MTTQNATFEAKMACSHKKASVAVYSCTETFLSEQIESIINDTILDEDSEQPMSHINIENTVKAITEFLVICHRTNIGTSKTTMCRQLQLSLQGRAQTPDSEDISSYETYYRLQYTVYEKLYEANAIYALFCMPTLNNLATLYLDNQDCPDKARKCLNNVLTFYREYTNGEQKLPEKMVEHADEDWVKRRTKDCQNIVEYFYTASLKICSRYYYIKKNYRMAMKVGLRYLRRMADVHKNTMKDSQWIETAINLSVTCVYSRALPQSVYLINAAVSLIDKMENDVKAEEHNNCGHVIRINHVKRRYIKHLRTEVDLSVIRIAVWILEESFKRVNYNNEPKKNGDKNDQSKDMELYETVETFSNVTKTQFTEDLLPTALCLEQKEFGALHKKARNLLKLHKKVIIKSSDWTDLQTRVQKIAQMRI